MIRIKGKEMAKLTGISEGYVRVLLKRRGLRLRQEFLEPVIDLILRLRLKKVDKSGEKD